MWVMYMLLKVPKILATFLVDFFYFIWKYTIFYFFASITDHREEEHPLVIKIAPQTQLRTVLTKTKDHN